MKISELIEELQKIQAKYGDVDVKYPHNDYGEESVGLVAVDKRECYSESEGKYIPYQYVCLY